MNSMKTVVLLAVLTALLLWVGKAIGGHHGMIIALVIAGVMNLGAYWFSDKIVLAMYRAQEVSRAEAPELYTMVQNLTQRAGLPMPKLYVVPSATPNAFATGRNPHHAAVAVTEGIMRLLNREELEGVIAHELAHIKNRDTLIQAVAATIAGAIMVVADMARFMMWFGGSGRDDDEGGANPLALLLMLILAPIAAMLIQLAISRSREYAADAGAAKMSGKPLALARALARLEEGNQIIPMTDARPATSHMFIVNPLRGGGLLALLSTHPPIPERIARLQEIARQIGIYA